jgi:hypothetical protein
VTKRAHRSQRPQETPGATRFSGSCGSVERLLVHRYPVRLATLNQCAHTERPRPSRPNRAGTLERRQSMTSLDPTAGASPSHFHPSAGAGDHTVRCQTRRPPACSLCSPTSHQGRFRCFRCSARPAVNRRPTRHRAARAGIGAKSVPQRSTHRPYPASPNCRVGLAGENAPTALRHQKQ